MYTLKKMKIEPKFYLNKLIVYLFLITTSCSFRSEKIEIKKEKKTVIQNEIIDCNAVKKYQSLIYFEIPNSENFIVNNGDLLKVLRSHLNQKYRGLKKINDEKIYYLDSSYFAFTFVSEISNCGELSFIGLIDTTSNQVLDTYFIDNEDNEFRWEFYANTITIYKKIVLDRDEKSRRRNCRLSFDFNRNHNITYTLADQDELINW
jgi:hypothetical protein